MDYTCTCDKGYEGKDCEKDTDDCVSVLCGGHGTCLDGLASFTCSCETGYSGELCEGGAAAVPSGAVSPAARPAASHGLLSGPTLLHPDAPLRVLQWL